ncbi:conserved protein of unknown function; putative membrane protein [Methylorubrum extorquens]|uniref:Uncharacterized protein n=1 Tax=Methylorubrum extorquens TaxID=408 RepID=A0A2N9AHY6_METEX|nr:hypothetical protein ASF59_10695 [Methylobacterium sp. Leaf121]SOR26967.1 conserved protein of unknown function; putative membrane protein [Methylorubrum extorquens]
MDGFFAPLFASGRIVDAILVLVVLEALVLLGMRARWGRGPAPGALLSNLASGAALMLALRAALTGTAWPGIAVWLAAALAAHLAEMVIRFQCDGVAASPDCDKPAGNNQKWRTFGARPPMT